jgi:SAM-dependent MidA family methyltransferase
MATLATTSSATLLDLLLNEIQQQPDRRITFATYMELVLYAPEIGYYARTPDRIGSRGDFFTSPHLSVDFGEMLAIQLAEMWELLDRPRPFMVVEMGAGQGLLAKDILHYWQQQYPELLADYVIVETSAAMRRCQQQVLFNQPVRWVEWADLAPESFQEVLGTPSTSQLLEYFEQAEIPILSYADGYRTEVNLAVIEWLQTVSSKLNRGYLLSIDYGYTSQRYYNPQRSQGTLQCYYQHRYHSNPYLHIGQQDLTAHVDFTSLIRHGNLWGLQELGFTKQGMFLMALGLADRISQPESLERRQALHQLIEPMGLGGFGVLLQGKNVGDSFACTIGDRVLQGFRG